MKGKGQVKRPGVEARWRPVGPCWPWPCCCWRCTRGRPLCPTASSALQTLWLRKFVHYHHMVYHLHHPFPFSLCPSLDSYLCGIETFCLMNFKIMVMIMTVTTITMTKTTMTKKTMTKTTMTTIAMTKTTTTKKTMTKTTTIKKKLHY